MRAAVLHAHGAAPAYADHADPAPGPDEVLVRVTAAPVVPLDLLCASGTSYFGARELPYVPGVQGIGEVVSGGGPPAGTRVFVSTSAGMADVDGARVLEVSVALGAAPVIVATARDDEADIVRLLNAGADDYLVKPFSAAQLDARIRAVLRRARPEPGQDAGLRVGELVLDPMRRSVELDGRALELTRKEFDLLQALMQRPGEVVSKRQLLADVWGAEFVAHTHYLRLYMGQLRAKIEEKPDEPRYLLTETGVGYRLAAP